MRCLVTSFFASAICKQQFETSQILKFLNKKRTLETNSGRFFEKKNNILFCFVECLIYSVTGQGQTLFCHCKIRIFGIKKTLDKPTQDDFLKLFSFVECLIYSVIGQGQTLFCHLRFAYISYRFNFSQGPPVYGRRHLVVDLNVFKAEKSTTRGSHVLKSNDCCAPFFSFIREAAALKISKNYL